MYGYRNLRTFVAIYQKQWTTHASTFRPSGSAYRTATDFHLLHKQYTDLKLIQLRVLVSMLCLMLLVFVRLCPCFV
jgi:hypothetical protein